MDRPKYLLGVLVILLACFYMTTITTPLYVVPAAFICGWAALVCINEITKENDPHDHTQ